MATIQDNNTILIYRVGPVLCCAPCISVISITHPAPLTKLPGQRSRHSGIFKFGSTLVNVCELRQNFGVDPDEWRDPGRIIITELSTGHIGFWVDDILDVMESPTTGWGNPPPLIPKATFSRTLTYNDEIHLYAEFENLYAIKQIGYLKSYIEHLKELKLKATKSKIDNNLSRLDKSANNDGEINTALSAEQDHKNNIKITTPSVVDTDNIKTSKQAHISKNKTSIDNIENSDAKKITPTPQTTPLKQDKLESKKIDTPEKKLFSKTIESKNKSRDSSSVITKSNITNNTKTTKENTKIDSDINKKIITKLNTAKYLNSNKFSKNNEIPDNEKTTPNISYHTNDSNNTYGILFTGIALLLVLLFGGYFYWQVNNTPENKKYAYNKDKATLKSEKTKTTSKNSALLEDKPDEPKQAIEAPQNITRYSSDEVIKKSTKSRDIQQITSFTHEPNSTEKKTIVKKSDPGYSADISNDSEGVTITVHTPVTNEQFDSLKEETITIDENNETISESQNTETEQALNTVSENVASEIQKPDTSSKDYKITIQVAKDLNSEKIAPSTITKEIIHIVVKGDTLWDIAKFYVDDPYRYPELARLSNIKNPDLIYPGNRVHIIQIFTNGKIQNAQ